MALVYPVIFGGSAPTSGDYLVRFIDFDGTILKEQWVNHGQAATAPTPPTHQYLTFDEWNNDYDNITHDLDVGATYRTTDGKTYLFMRFTNTTGLQPAIYLNKADTSLMTINWGDGTSQTTSASRNIAITKTDPYTAIGDYTITIECVGDWSFYTFIFRNNVLYNNCLIKVYMPGSTIALYNSVFSYCFSLSTISLNKYIIITGSSIFYRCYSLIALIIPRGWTSINKDFFFYAMSMQLISLPQSIAFIYSGSFYFNFSLLKIMVPNVSLFALNAFNQCYSFTYFTLGFSTTSIDQNTFYSCNSILKYIFLPTTPPTLGNSNALTGINNICKIYVPDASVSAYQGATNWNSFPNYIYPISELAEYAGTIFFQCNGGNAVKQIKGIPGAIANAPSDPTKAGFSFAGWYKEAALTNAWNWATDVYPATNITLYAKWV